VRAMAPKKKEEPPPEEEKKEEEAPPEPVVEQRHGNFVLPNGSTYVGQYNCKFLVPVPPPDYVVGTALEPLQESESLEIHGRGKLLFGPELYDGEWRNGQMTKGKHVFASGAVYEGFFLHNQFHGQGKYSWADGREYEGLFAAGQMHGAGVYRSFTSTAAAAFEGVSVHGQFQSGHVEQDALQAKFCAAYGAPLLESAKAALAKGADGHWPELLVAPGLERDWAAGRALGDIVERCKSPDQIAEDETAEDLEKAIEEAQAAYKEITFLLDGPFPTAVDFPLLHELVEGLTVPPPADGEEPAAPATAMTLCEAQPPQVRKAQLRYLGQCVQLAGASGTVLLCNVGWSKGDPAALDTADAVADYDVTKACWRLVAAEKAQTEE